MGEKFGGKTMKKCIGIWLLLGLFVFVIATDVSVKTVKASEELNTGVLYGWVKLHPYKKTTQEHNAYTVNKKIGTFGAFEADNVREGDDTTHPVIPDGEYYVTFWVTGKTGSGREVTDVEHKKKMKFVGGKMQGEIRLTVELGTITSAGVSYPE